MSERAGPIFIVSAMGSGSTLIRLILDSHPNIAIPRETGFMRAYNAHAFIPLKWGGHSWAKRMGWSRKELDHELAELYDRIFSRHAAAHGKHRWGDKTPLHTWHVDAMARLFPDARFIGMIRHPGATVGSNVGRFGHPFNRAVVHVERYQREIARQAAAHPKRFAIIRYEELVLRPEPMLRELMDWLGEPWADSLLAHHEVQAARGGELVVEGTSRADQPIEVSRITKWHKRMTPAHRKDLEDKLGRLAAFFGYSMHDPAVLEPLRPGGRLLVRGRHIAARMDGYPDLDLRAEPDRPLAERPWHPGRMQLHPVGRLALRRPAQVEPPLSVRLWHVLPRTTRRRLYPAGFRARRLVKRTRRRLRRR